MDKEYIVLSEIEKNSKITQRELSKKTELSLGSVNILLNKMAKEGLIKIKQIPMNRVLYMLTPAGMSEKIRKTSAYIKYHYNYINETKTRITSVIQELQKQHNSICIILDQDEIGNIVMQIANEIGIVYSFDTTNIKSKCVVVTSVEKEQMFMNNDFLVINLLKLI